MKLMWIKPHIISDERPLLLLVRPPKHFNHLLILIKIKIKIKILLIQYNQRPEPGTYK